MSDNPIFFVNESIKIQQPSQIVQDTHAAEVDREPADKPPALVSEMLFAEQARRASVVHDQTSAEEDEARAAAALLWATQLGGGAITRLEEEESRKRQEEEEEKEKKLNELKNKSRFGE